MSSNDEINLDIVFAKESFIAVHPHTGVGMPVVIGTHWPADDPIAKEYPKFFTADARYGLSSSEKLADDGYPDRAPYRRTETTDATPGTRRGRGQGTTR